MAIFGYSPMNTCGSSYKKSSVACVVRSKTQGDPRKKLVRRPRQSWRLLHYGNWNLTPILLWELESDPNTHDPNTQTRRTTQSQCQQNPVKRTSLGQQYQVLCSHEAQYKSRAKSKYSQRFLSGWAQSDGYSVGVCPLKFNRERGCEEV